MLNFKQFLLEGGNVRIGEHEAQRIDLKTYNRDWIVPRIERTLKVINLTFQKASGLPLWNPDLFKSKEFLSGSAFHFFNKQIATSEFIQYKNTVGDIDTQVDKYQEQHIQKFLDAMVGHKLGYATFIGYKKSIGQFITLWQFDKPAINIQIDLELVDFANGKPTKWANFSHSSAWEDMREGIKGVFQKYLLRAFTTKSLRDIIILKGKKETPTKIKSTDLAFSVTQGIRMKLTPVYENGHHKVLDGLYVYKELATKDSQYISEIELIFENLFGVKPTETQAKQLESFIGGLELAKQFFNAGEQKTLILGFAHTLWGPGAQGLYKGNPELDHKEKMIAFNKMVNTLKIPYDKELINKMRAEYYVHYKV